MPLFLIARLIAALASWGLLALALYLLGTWFDGEAVQVASGEVLTYREDWRLWTGAGLLLWSLGGRFVVLALATRRDTQPTRPLRQDGEVMASPTGSTLYVERQNGSGPTIILTHGWGLDSTIWHDFRRDAAARRPLEPHRIVAWDLPGLGRSGARGDGITIERFADDLAMLVDRVAGPVVLVGHSIGGMTIQTLARRRPDLFDGPVVGVALLNTTYTNPLKTMILSGLVRALRWPLLEPLFRVAIWLQPLIWLGAWQSYLSGSTHLANLVGFGSRPTRSQLEHVSLLTTRNPPGVQARGNLAMFRWDATGAMAAVPVPVLVVGGQRDIVTKLEASESIAAACPNGRLERVEKANHLGFLERGSHYNRVILDFVAECAGPPAPVRTS